MMPSSPSAYLGPSSALEPLSSGDGRVRLAPAFPPAPPALEPPQGPTLARPAQLRARIVKSRFGYYAHLTYGLARVGEVGSFSFTRRGIERKVKRIGKKIKRQEARLAAAEELVV